MELIQCFFSNFFRIISLNKKLNCIEIFLSTNNTNSFCPICGKSTNSIHSTYIRTIIDLPIVNNRLILIIQSKRYHCKNENCYRKIFCERLVNFAKVYARRTDRLEFILVKVAVLVSSVSGSKLSDYLNVNVSNSTILRIVRKIDVKINENAKIIAIDDWAYKKNNTYGTIICDHETHNVIDIFEGRSSEDLENWLYNFDHIEIITRDGSLTYKSAVDKFDTNIIQIGDRFHIVSNLLKYLIEYVKNNFPTKIIYKKTTANEEEITVSLHEKENNNELNFKKKAKLELIRKVKSLHKDRISGIEIAKILKINKKTVYKYIEGNENVLINYNMTKPRLCKAESYSNIINEMLKQNKNKKAIFDEITQLGFDGTYSSLANYIRNNRDYINTNKTNSNPKENTITDVITQQEVINKIWNSESFDDDYEDILSKKSHQYLKVRDIVEEFRLMIKNKSVEKLDDWINKVLSTNIKEFKSFVNGLLKDISAVKNAIIYHYSNGLAEGHINRLKVIKRIMYGRANLDLLKIKCLYQL
jgi:transposase